MEGQRYTAAAAWDLVIPGAAGKVEGQRYYAAAAKILVCHQKNWTLSIGFENPGLY